MQKKTSRLPLLIFLVVFTAPVLAVVLMARDGRNLKIVAARLGIEWSEPATTDPTSPSSRSTSGLSTPGAAVPGGQPVPEPSRPPTLEQKLIAAPSGSAELARPLVTTDPRSQCEDLARLVRGASPTYQATGSSWDCTMELRARQSDDVLFLQVRGEQARYSFYRAKINLYDGRALSELADRAAQALSRYEPVDITYVARLMRETIEADRNHEGVLAHGTITIQREWGEERRYNVFVRPSVLRPAPATPFSGFGFDREIGEPGR